MKQYPLSTVVYYGPNDQKATKLVVSIFNDDSGKITDMKKWYSEIEGEDLRENRSVKAHMLAFHASHGVENMVKIDYIFGCPHEEGIDYPEGEVCLECPFWADK